MTKIGRNAPCPCGSGLKYKRCCEGEDAFDELVESTDLHEKLEFLLAHEVYQSVLLAVWKRLGPGDDDNPPLEELEEFFEFIYGRPLDRNALDRVVLPLPREPLATLLSPQDKVSPDDEPELFLPGDPETPPS